MSPPFRKPIQGLRISIFLHWLPQTNACSLRKITIFGELVVRQRLKVAGVILLELDRLPRSAHAERVLETVSKYEDRVAGNLLVIEGARTRIRRLQI